MIMDAYLYERLFVQVIAELGARVGLNDSQLAVKAWPHQKSAAAAWRKMRNDPEHPKRLNLEEAVLLSNAVGVSITDVCGIVQARLLEINSPRPFFPAKNQKEVPVENDARNRESLQRTYADVEGE